MLLPVLNLSVKVVCPNTKALLYYISANKKDGMDV